MDADERVVRAHAEAVARALNGDGRLTIEVDGTLVDLTVCPHHARPRDPPLRECERDILKFLLARHPARFVGEELHHLMERAGLLHGLTTVKLALARLRNDHHLLVNDLDGRGYGLSGEGLRVAGSLR
jgi:hypothetical protein